MTRNELFDRLGRVVRLRWSTNIADRPVEGAVLVEQAVDAILTEVADILDAEGHRLNTTTASSIEVVGWWDAAEFLRGKS